MDRAARNFIIIIAMDIVVFCVSLYIWCKKRSKIIAFLHTGFTGLRINYYRKQKDTKDKVGYFDNFDHVDVKRPHLFRKNGTQRVEATGGDSVHYEQADEGPTEQNSIYVDSNGDTGPKAPTETLPAQINAGKSSWLHHLLYGNASNIRNNEAVLYLRFMRSTCMMLLLCSAVALVSNGIIYTHLALKTKPYIITTYTIEDLTQSRLVVWMLYATTWIYSIIVYVYILNFRSMVNEGKQIAVILRPQLHTIMVTGFDKTVTDPTYIYNHFNKYFPQHILSVHIVVNHSKRMILEEELEATKAQLTLCRDMSFMMPLKNKERPALRKKNPAQMSEDDTSAEVCRKQDRSAAVHRRSRSCEDLLPKGDSKRGETINRLHRKASSSKNLLLMQKSDKNDAKTEVKVGSKGNKSRLLSVFQRGTEGVQEQHTESCHDVYTRLASLVKRVKELKVLIVEEGKRKHTTSASVCFVSFTDPNLVLHILKDRKILEEMPTWRICPAPHPRDIIWKHLHLPRWYIILKMLFYNLCLTVFYCVITWIISHLNLLHTVKSQERLSKGVAEKFNIRDISERSFWRAIMPPMVMATLNTCVHPTMINTLSRKIGFWTQSTYQKYLLFGHVFYLIISTILIPLVASMISFWKIFDGAFESLSIDLGKVLVSTSWRFSTIYVFNATFLGSSNQLLQLSQISVRSLGLYLFKYDIGMTNFDFGYWYAFHLSILTLVMLFSVFIPYLPMLGTLYFAIRYCVDRHNIAYDVLQLPLDSTGKISASAVKSMMLCISITQFAMSGVFLNCQHVLPPLCITLLYIASVATWLLLYASNSDTMVNAVEALHKLKLKPLNKVMMETIKVCYMHPCDSNDLMEAK